MDKFQILAIGRDPVILQSLLRFINENPKWEGTGTVNDESAVEIFHQKKYDIILLIDAIEEASEKKFRSLFTFNDPEIIFIKHNGSSTGLLVSEIQEALDNKRKALNVQDDIFKNKKPE